MPAGKICCKQLTCADFAFVKNENLVVTLEIVEHELNGSYTLNVRMRITQEYAWYHAFVPKFV